MGKKGGSRHLKRMPAPTFWPIHRKEFQWVVKPKPGPHPLKMCLPLLLVAREIIGFAKTRKEAKVIFAEGQVKVDGNVRREEKFPVGLMDVIEVQSLGKAYRVVPESNKGLTLHAIKGEEQKFKLCRIENKRTVKGGAIQLNLHDGRNILIKIKDPRNPEEDVYDVSDILKISIPDQKILDHIKLDEGSFAVVTGGKNIGRYGKIVKIERRTGPFPTVVTIEDKKGNSFQTILDYVFVVGKNKPLISLPEVD